MITTEKLTKVFRTEDVETYALSSVDIHVKGGEFVAIMGPSGCGKSTLLNIIGLLDNSTEVDFVAWSGGPFQSIMRVSLDVDTDTQVDWIRSSVPTPTESLKDSTVPEPATMLMLLSGLFGLGFLKKK